MSKFLNESGVAHLWAKVKAYVAAALASLHYAGSDEAGGAATMALALPAGSIDATSTATVLTATVPGITELRDGVCCVLYNYGKASASGCTLNVNGLGAKPIYLCTGSTRVTTQVVAGYTLLFIYRSSLNSGAGGWRLGQIFNSNTTYSLIPSAELQAGTATTARTVSAARLHENYRIEDDGTIHIAGRSITPLTEHQDIKSLLGIPLSGEGNVTISFQPDLATGHLSLVIDTETPNPS